MKKTFTTIFIVFSILLLMAFTKYRRQPVIIVNNIISAPVVEIDTKIKPKEIKIKDHKAFLTALGHRESGNRYNIVNRYGYMGRYQFGKSTLRTLRIKVSRSEFLKDTLLQEEAMTKLLRFNKKRLQKYIDRYSGETVNGVLITESGLLAAAHLGGAGSVKKWFRTGKVRRDGNGVKITSYMKRFGGYILYL